VTSGHSENAYNYGKNRGRGGEANRDKNGGEKTEKTQL